MWAIRKNILTLARKYDHYYTNYMATLSGAYSK